MEKLISVQIETKEGINVVSSRVVAEQLGKRHADVVNQIEKLATGQNETFRFGIIESQYNDRGRMCKEYLLTKDGFTLYMFNIQGYNDFKMAYINAFNKMEQALKGLTLPSYQIFDPIERAKKWIEEETIRQEQAKQLEAQKPKVLFADAVETSQRSCLVAELAKILKQNGVDTGQNRLFKWLRENGYLGNKGEYYNQPTQKAMDMGLFELKKRTVNNPDGSVMVVTTTKVTPKGQIYFVNKLIEK